MKNRLTTLVEKHRPRCNDVVGLDFGASGVKGVRLRRGRDGRLTVVAADVLPPARPPAAADGADEVAAARVAPLHLPKPLRARVASLCLSSPAALAKLMVLPGSAEKIESTPFADLLGVPKGAAFRCGHRLLESETRGERHVLAVALPECEAAWFARLLPRGSPAPGVAELSGLAALSSYQAGPGRGAVEGNRCDLVIDGGAEVTFLGLFFRGRPVVVRQFAKGALAVRQQIMRDLGVDTETASNVLEVGSIDARTSVRAVFEPFFRQVSIAIDFAERRVNGRLQKLYIAGGLSGNSDWREELRALVGLAPETWSPWDGMDTAPGALTERATRPGVCFAAATGTALATLENG